MNPAPNLVLVGPMGAGKTSIGRRVAERLGLEFVDADQWIEARMGVPVRTIFDLEGEAGFRRREREALAALCSGSGRLVATGGGAVLDPENRALLRRSGFVVWLRVTVERQLERLARDRSRPLLAAPDRRERLASLAAQRDPLYAEVADWIFEADGRKVGAAAERLAAALAQRWQREECAA